MAPYLVATFLMCLSSLATSPNFTLVFEWHDEWEFEWPSEEIKTQTLGNRTFGQKNVRPSYMAVYGRRIFLSLEKYDTKKIPVTLVSLPMRSASSASPKLKPFPSWKIHGKGNCAKMEEAKGLEVDSVGRLWVLDQGSFPCSSKLWIIDLANRDNTRVIHWLSVHDPLHDLVLDESPNGIFAYISLWRREYTVVFSLETHRSWTVGTPGVQIISIALSPKEEPRQFYLSHLFSKQLYSISVAALRNESLRYSNPKLIGTWTAYSTYRMLIDNRGTMFAAFRIKNYISSLDTSLPLFEEQRFYEVSPPLYFRPVTFALDQKGTFWLLEFDHTGESRHRIMKASVGGKSYIFKASPERSRLPARCTSTCLPTP